MERSAWLLEVVYTRLWDREIGFSTLEVEELLEASGWIEKRSSWELVERKRKGGGWEREGGIDRERFVGPKVGGSFRVSHLRRLQLRRRGP